MSKHKRTTILLGMLRNIISHQIKLKNIDQPIRFWAAFNKVNLLKWNPDLNRFCICRRYPSNLQFNFSYAVNDEFFNLFILPVMWFLRMLFQSSSWLSPLWIFILDSLPRLYINFLRLRIMEIIYKFSF